MLLTAAVLNPSVAPRPVLRSGSGTAAVVMRSPHLLMAAIDSKETYRLYRDGGVSIEEGEICKADRIGPYFAMVAGLDRGSNGYDALREVSQTWRPTDNLDALAARAGASLSPLLSGLLSQIRDADAKDFTARYGGQPALELSLFGVENRVPRVVILEFSVKDTASSSLTLSLHTTRCPGDCAQASTAYFLGTHQEIDRAVRSNPALISPPKEKNIEALIDLEKSERPELVGGPVAVIGMDQSGAILLHQGACPAEALQSMQRK